MSDWTLAEEVVHLMFIRAYQRLAEFRADPLAGLRDCVGNGLDEDRISASTTGFIGSLSRDACI